MAKKLQRLAERTGELAKKAKAAASGARQTPAKPQGKSEGISFIPVPVVFEANIYKLNEAVYNELVKLEDHIIAQLKLNYLKEDHAKYGELLRLLAVDVKYPESAKNLVKKAPNAIALLAQVNPAALVTGVVELMPDYKNNKDAIRAYLQALTTFCEDVSLYGPLFEIVYEKCINPHGLSHFLPEVRNIVVGEQAQNLEAFANSGQNFLHIASLMSVHYDKLSEFEKNTWQRYLIQAMFPVKRDEDVAHFALILQNMSTNKDVLEGILLALRQTALNLEGVWVGHCMMFLQACYQSKRASTGLAEGHFNQFVQYIISVWQQQSDANPIKLVEPFSEGNPNRQNFLAIVRDNISAATLKTLPLEFCVAMGDRELFFRALAARVGVELSDPINDYELARKLLSNHRVLIAEISALTARFKWDDHQCTMVRNACFQTRSILNILAGRFNHGYKIGNHFSIELYYNEISHMLPNHVEHWSKSPRRVAHFHESMLIAHTLVRQGKFLAAAPYISESDRTKEFFTGQPYRFEYVLGEVKKALAQEERRVEHEKHDAIKAQIVPNFQGVFQSQDYHSMLEAMVKRKELLDMDHIRAAAKFLGDGAIPPGHRYVMFAKVFAEALRQKLTERDLSEDDQAVIRGMLNKIGALLYLSNEFKIGTFLRDAWHPLLRSIAGRIARRDSNDNNLLLELFKLNQEEQAKLVDSAGVNFYDELVPAIFHSGMQNFRRLVSEFIQELYRDFPDHILRASGTCIHLGNLLDSFFDNFKVRTAGRVVVVMLRLSAMENNAEAFDRAVRLFVSHAEKLSKIRLSWANNEEYFNNFLNFVLSLDKMSEEQQSQFENAVKSILPQLAASFAQQMADIQNINEHLFSASPAVFYLYRLIKASGVEYPEFTQAMKIYAAHILKADLSTSGLLLAKVSVEDFNVLYQSCGDEELQIVTALHNHQDRFATTNLATTLKNHLVTLSEQSQESLLPFCSRMMQLHGRTILHNLAGTQSPDYFQQPCMKPLMREYFVNRFQQILHKLYLAYRTSYQGKSKGLSMLQRRGAKKSDKLVALQEIFRNGNVFQGDMTISTLSDLALQVSSRDVFENASNPLRGKNAHAQIVDDMALFFSMIDDCPFEFSPDNQCFELDSELEQNFKSHGYGQVNP